MMNIVKEPQRHDFNRQFAITRSLAELRDSLLDILEPHGLRLPQHRREETLGCSNRDAQIDIVAIDDRVVIDDRCSHSPRGSP